MWCRFGAAIVSHRRRQCPSQSPEPDSGKQRNDRSSLALIFAKEPPDPDNPLLRMDNVVVIPHNGGGTVDTMKRIIGHSFANILKVERGEPLPAADRVKGT